MPSWLNRQKNSQYRLFFATDIHGSEPTFRKFINAGKAYGVDALVLGGDITGKMLIPIIDLGQGSYTATLQSKAVTMTAEDLPAFENKLAKLGFYSKIMDQQQYEHNVQNPSEVEKLYLEKASQRLTSWIRLAEERLAGTPIRCYITGGNDDHQQVVELLQQEAQDRVVACEEKVVPLNDEYLLVSLGYSNPTPWKTPREIPEEELAVKIEDVFKGVEDCGKVVFNMHVPPVDSTLDTCPMLDTSTDPPTVVTSGGEPVMFGAGSQVVKDAIQKYQPLLSLHGHIHESRGVIKIGRTTAVNPGSEYGEGILRGTIVSLQGDKVKSAQLTSG
jgi:Icc-related predicted phosphoesterase